MQQQIMIKTKHENQEGHQTILKIRMHKNVKY